MKRSLLLCFFMLVMVRVQAQQYEINLADQRTSKPLPNFEIDSIIDLRYDKTNIGWVQKGASNIKLKANLTGGLETELKGFLKTNRSTIGGTVPVIVKVNKLAVSERIIGDRQYATAEVALEFLTPDKNRTGYCLLLQAGSAKETSSLTDVTGSHSKNLAAAAEDCFNQLGAINFSEKCAASPPLPVSYLQENSYYKTDHQTIPILAASSPKRGVYLTFQEFKNNAPSLNKEVTMNQVGNFFFKSTGKKVKELWGFSDGIHSYIRFADEPAHYLLVKKKDHFTFIGNVQTTDDGSVVIGTLVGGVAGGLLASRLTENVRAIEFSLNPITGMVNPIQNAGPEPEPDQVKPSKVLIYRNNKNESAGPLTIMINDSVAAQLSPDSFSEFTLKAPVSEQSICVEAGQRYCQKVMPDLDRVLYYECSLPVKGTGKPILKPVTEQEARYYLKIIKHNQKKPGN